MAAPGSPVIVGRALVGSLGLDVVTACAAARAGIVRASAAEQFLAADDQRAAGSPIAVHRVAGLTDGFEGPVRLARLLAAALQDLRIQLPDAPWRKALTGVFLAMPSPRRETEGAALLPTPEARAKFEQEAARAVVVDPEERGERLFAQALQFAEWGEPLALQFVDTSGTTAIASALNAAREALQQGRVQLAIVAGVDSLVEARTLDWLDRTARLRTPNRPAGVHPGEASALLVLEESAHARSRRATPLATVETCVTKVEPQPILSGGIANGAALAAAIDALRAQAGWDQRMPSITLDLNGENARASEWGNALTHLIARSPVYQDVAIEIPALSFGDTGAASGAVAACMALHAFARGYASSDTVAIVNASDGGARTAFLLRAPGA